MQCSWNYCVVVIILCFINIFTGVHAAVNRRSNDVFNVQMYNASTCSSADALRWTSTFHDCFMERKYGDGGRDLNSIVDRILEHSSACIEISSKDCRLNFDGFLQILNKTIAQIKDYAEIYLEAIYQGREKIKDLECVEKILTIDSYESCFAEFFQSRNKSDDFDRSAEESISCVNRKNKGCSNEARTSLNRMVRVILGVREPGEENFEPEEAPVEKPWMWYDYLAYPFVTAWNAVRNFFNF